MGDFTDYTISAGQTISSAYENYKRDHAFEKIAYYIVRNNSGTCEAVKGATSSGAGSISYSGTNGATVVQAVFDNAPLDSLVYIKDVDINTTITLSRRVNLVIDCLEITTNNDALVIGGQATTTSLPIRVYVHRVKAPNNYTKSAIKLHNVKNCNLIVDMMYLGTTGSDGTAIHLLGDGAGSYYNTVELKGYIGGYDISVLLESAGTGGNVNNNWLYGGLVYAATTGIKLVNGSTAVGDNHFYGWATDGATKMTTAIYNEGTETRFYGFNKVDMGTQTQLNNTSGASAWFFGGSLDADYVTNNGTLHLIEVNEYIIKNSSYSTGTGAQQTVAHGCDFTPSESEVFLSERTTGGALAKQTAAPDATNIYITATSAKDYNWRVEKA